MRWSDAAHAWLAEPEEVVSALCHEGFEECKREAARIGGVRRGLDTRTGAVASAVWVVPPRARGRWSSSTSTGGRSRAMAGEPRFAEPDGGAARPEDWWGDLDRDLLACFEGDGPVSIGAVALRLGISEHAAISLVAMLACQGKVHIRLVERGREATTMERQAMPERGARLAAEAAGAEAGRRALALAGANARALGEAVDRLPAVANGRRRERRAPGSAQRCPARAAPSARSSSATRRASPSRSARSACSCCSRIAARRVNRASRLSSCASRR